MRITWRDGITTLATAGAIVLERAYFHDWDWPLVSSMRWVITGLAILMAVNYLFGYVIDHVHSAGWSFTATAIAVITLVLTGLGLAFVVSDYVVLLMLASIVFWLASMLRHLTVQSPMVHSHS